MRNKHILMLLLIITAMAAIICFEQPVRSTGGSCTDMVGADDQDNLCGFLIDELASYPDDGLYYSTVGDINDRNVKIQFMPSEVGGATWNDDFDSPFTWYFAGSSTQYVARHHMVNRITRA